MTRTNLARLSLILFCLAATAPPSAGQGDQGPSNPLELTPAERAAVRELAERTLKDRGLFKGKVYLTRIEVFRDTSDKASERKAIVTHYRYEGDLAILTSVNVGRKEVIGVETIPHFPTSLAPEELALA